jgi:type IV secretion system protein VirB10
MSEAVIDAGAVVGERERERERNAESDAGLTGERDGSSLAGARRVAPAGARIFVAILGVLVAAIVVVLIWKSRHLKEDDAHKKNASTERIEKRAPSLQLARPLAAPPVEPLPATAPAPAVSSLPPAGEPPLAVAAGVPAGARQPAERDLVLERRLSPGFGAVQGDGVGSGGGARLAQSEPRNGELEEKLEAVELKVASAGVLPDRDYLLTQGAMLDCVLETKIVSTVAGMTSCHLTRDVYSSNGHVVLLDRGSKIVGRYQSGVQAGEARIFVLWTRAETPNGVVVDLQSPGTGPLGEAGLGGWVDSHFADRFGAAILLSVIQDATDAAAAKAAGPARNSVVTFGNQAAASKEVVGKAMEPTINIPPTLYKNQGERVGIFVARDLDFRGVYGLESGRD